MKYFIFLLLFIATNAWSQCTGISRTNVSPNSVISSTAWNLELNTVYGAANNLSGDCITDGTLPASVLDTSEFATLLKAPKIGCDVSRSDSNTISVSRCDMAVNDAYVNTTVATTVTWGCGGCSAEAASTSYYVYALDTSTGSTLNLLISTSAPNGDGYDSSNNRVLARFYNDGSQDITPDVVNWSGENFNKISNSANYDGLLRIEACDLNINTTTITSTNGICDGWIEAITKPSTGQLDIDFMDNLWGGGPNCTCTAIGLLFCHIRTGPVGTGEIQIQLLDHANTATDGTVHLQCIGERG